MKTLLLLITSIALVGTHPAHAADSFSFSQSDKQKHIAATSGITFGSSYVIEKSGSGKTESVLWGSLISMTVGFFKEFVLDSKPSGGDLVANSIGTALGAGASFTISF